jgi:hypothetical protein
VKHALVFVSIAIAGGLTTLLALRPVAPGVGPIVSLAVISVALLFGSFAREEAKAEDVHEAARRSTLPLS